MYLSAIFYSLLLTLIATAYSKSIGFANNEEMESTTDARITSNLSLIHGENESDPKLSAKRSLLILMPVSEEEEELDCDESHSQKTKRCKSLLVGSPMDKPNEQKNKKKEEIFQAIRERMKSRDEIVGAVHESSLTKTEVFDDGKRVCYCRPKNNLPVRKGTNRFLVPDKINPKEEAEKRNTLVGRKPPNPIRGNTPRRPVLPKTHPVLTRKGQETIPYIPYVNSDPEENPMRFNIPLNSAATKPDSIVGQRAPIYRPAENQFETSLSSAKDDKEQPANAHNEYNLESTHSLASEANEGAENKETYGQETTRNEAFDYSDIKVVTNSYFTSKAYSGEIDDFPVTAEESFDENSGRNEASQETRYLANEEANDDVLGQGNPRSNNENTADDDTEQHEEYNESSSNEASREISMLKNSGEESFVSKEMAGSSNDPTNDRETTEGNDSLVGKAIYNVGDKTSFETEQATSSVESSKEDSQIESTAKGEGIKGAEDPKDRSEQLVPFCDNSLLQNSIKAVINKFARDESEEETVGSARNEDFLPEIVGIPNLKGILTMPSIEQTIMDKVKDRLSKIITVDRKTFDNDKTNNAIRDTLRHILSAAPIPKTELPPMTVEEHQFKNGKWVTSLVTLEPPSNDKTGAPNKLEKMRASIRKLVRDPAVGLQAAKQPAVQNMIVESVRNDFGTKGKEAFDDTVIRSCLNEELSIMQAENGEYEENAKVDETTEETGETGETGGTGGTGEAGEAKSLDVSNIDMGKLLEIAKSEAGVDDDQENASLSEKQKTKDNVVGATRNEEAEEETKIGNPRSNYNNYREEMLNNDRNVAPKSEEIEDEKEEENGGMNKTGEQEQLGHLGIISLGNEKDADGARDLQNSELYYIGDGVKLPLEIRKLKDGSYALSISRKICQHLLNKECPCCVPVQGNIIRTKRTLSSSVKHADERIRSDKRERIFDSESRKSISPTERRKRDSADDSLQIFSMPVNAFAKRYNLSLNLMKAQAPWNFDEMEKIDEQHAGNRPKNLKDKERNKPDIGLPNDLLLVHPIADNDETNVNGANGHSNEDRTSFQYQMQNQRHKIFDEYRYQRDIDENLNKRVEIIKSILHWLKDTVSNASSKST